MKYSTRLQNLDNCFEHQCSLMDYYYRQEHRPPAFKTIGVCLNNRKTCSTVYFVERIVKIVRLTYLCSVHESIFRLTTLGLLSRITAFFTCSCSNIRLWVISSHIPHANQFLSRDINNIDSTYYYGTRIC